MSQSYLSLKRLPIAVAGQHKNDIELQKKSKAFFILIITVIERKNTKKDIKSKELIVNRKK